MTRAVRRAPFAARLALALALAAACGGEDATVVGTLERDRLELVAEANEPIVEIAVEEGATVAEGQLLLRLAPDRLQALREAADQRVALAEARLEEALRGPRSEDIARARARFAGAREAFATAEREAARAEALRGAGAASDELADERARALALARADRDAARAELDRLLAGTRSEQVDQARAQLEEARATARDAALREQRLAVRAPRAGAIDALPFEVGERPPAGAVVAVMLADGAPYARVFVPAALRARVAPGAAARVHVDGVDAPFAARVRSVSSDAAFTPYYALTKHDRGRLTWVAEIDLTEDAARALPTGLPVEAELELAP